MPCKRILIVEDDEDISDSLAELLALEGYQVLQAYNGQQAIEYLKTICSDPCLILLDLMMPVMNGWEFLELKNSNIHLASIPVTVISAVANRVDDHPGVNVVLRKPVDLSMLVGVVNLYCGRLAQDKPQNEAKENK